MSLAGNGRGDKMCGETNSDALHKAICQSTSQGVLFIAAAGNSASNIARVVPASYPSVLTVTAMADSDGAPGGLGSPLTCRGWEEDDHAASFSNFALVPLEEDAVDNATTYSLPFASPLHAELFQFVPSGDVTEHLVSAPGTCIVSTVRDGRLGVLSGTSQACPHVTGLVALAFGSNGIPGPCATLAPLLCMRYFVSRARRLQQEAGLGFGFLPWTTERATRAGRAARGGG
jgi:subtilisin family serine protease